VVLDNPKGDYYGGAASAPVFAQVAQQTLEYLGVPHDVEVRAVHPGTKPEKDQEPVQEHTGDANALMAAVNELPSDDPLRQAVNGTQQATEVVVSLKTGPQSKAPPVQQDSSQETTSVAVGHSKLVRVPSMIGLPVRKVAEQAAMAGLNLQVQGRGLVRSQEPAAGSQVQAGSAVLVHCTR
jgi:cell division protein FtsI (penicillin-binding protein 3)